VNVRFVDISGIDGHGGLNVIFINEAFYDTYWKGWIYILDIGTLICVTVKYLQGIVCY